MLIVSGVKTKTGVCVYLFFFFRVIAFSLFSWLLAPLCGTRHRPYGLALETAFQCCKIGSGGVPPVAPWLLRAGQHAFLNDRFLGVHFLRCVPALQHSL